MNTQQTAKHTPLPWKSEVPPSSCFTCRAIRGENGEYIAKIGHMDFSQGVFEDVANAEFIVRACNSHYELVEALKQAEIAIFNARNEAAKADEFNSNTHTSNGKKCYPINLRVVDVTWDALDKIRVALTSAQGKEN